MDNFKTQAVNCNLSRDIKSDGERDFIPRSIRSAYKDDILRNTQLQRIAVSAGNLLFLCLNNQERNDFNLWDENKFISSERIIGLNRLSEIDPFFPSYGEAILQSPPGFSGYVHKKSCMGYFDGYLEAGINPPLVDITSSLKADAKMDASIITVKAQFVSPLNKILEDTDPFSVYTHLLLWKIYASDYDKTRSSNRDLNNALINGAHYISEFRGLTIYHSADASQNSSINSSISGKIALGIFSIDGKITAGASLNNSFSLKDFNTYINISKTDLNYISAPLPTVSKINDRLKNSLRDPAIISIVTDRLPTTITRTLVGIPSSFCQQGTWYIDAHGYQKHIWESAPTVNLTYDSQDKSIPKCICQVTGQIKKSVVEKEVPIEFEYTLTSQSKIGENNLQLKIKEPPVSTTTSPNIYINDQVINSSIKKIKTATGDETFEWEIDGIIFDEGVPVALPMRISQEKIIYSNPSQQGLLAISMAPIKESKNTKINIKYTKPIPENYTKTGNSISIPITIKFKILLRDKNWTITELTSKAFNLSIPEFKAPTELETKSDKL